MIWTFVAVVALALSTVGTGLIVFKLYKDWDIRASSVRWLFAIFFTFQFINSAARLVYTIWLCVGAHYRKDSDDDEVLEGQAVVGVELYRIGTNAVLTLAQNDWITAVIIIGDTTYFGLTLWIAALVYELSKLVALSMDRGEKHEQAKIRLYSWLGHSCIAMYFAVQVILAIIFTGYSKYAYMLLLVVNLLQIIVLVYMITMVILLKIKGRNYESVHGRFVTSPPYQRLKWIMLVYALFAFQFQFSSLIFYAMPGEKKRLSGYVGVSFVLYYLRGFVLSIVTGCSLPCIVRILGYCAPDEIKAQYTQRRECVTVPGGWDLPYINPVFVFTDIESSSALWAMEDGQVMQQATQIHDDILRGLLASYRGYEITTAGDSFQLAFHTIQEAVEYCLDVQTQLLDANWPKDLHGLVPATSKVRAGTKTIFCGLRVRMGVHDAVGSEGSLVQDVHAVTGKLTYTGASEVIANEIGDLGAGGQILVTQRVAEWIAANSSQISTKFMMEPVCEYSIPRLSMILEVFQVVPKPLAMRCGSFDSPRHIVQIEREDSRLRNESHTFYNLMQTDEVATGAR